MFSNCWRGLFGVSWTARRPSQSTLKEINLEFSLEAEAETPIFWLPDVKNWPSWKDSDAEKDQRWEEKEMTEDEMDMSLSKLQEMVTDRKHGVLQSMTSQRAEHDWAAKQQQMLIYYSAYPRALKNFVKSALCLSSVHVTQHETWNS